jgi:tRNA-2-methylthio-N6-dimethylallyladenosine synthase
MVQDKGGKFYRLMKRRLPLVDEFLPIDEVGFDIPIKRESKTHAWVIVSNGCNNFCSYCIVPFTRGREVSRSWQDIMTEVDDLAAKGYRQVTLLGQNVNSYGADFVKEYLIDGRYTLPDGRAVLPVVVNMSMGRKRVPTIFPYLLEEVAKRGFEKVSFLSPNPWDFSDRLIDVIARSPNIDRYIHLPVQAGDNQVLRRMNRWYTVEEYKDLVGKIRKRIPKVEIGTDIIVGFPGETEEAFQNTVKLAREIGWSVAYIGMYSPRPHTTSYKNFPDDISSEEKRRRFHIFDQLINKKKQPAFAA